MEYSRLEQFVSPPRLDRYLVSCANSQDKAKRLYGANVLVSQAFYPILNLLETFLRNSINEKMSTHYSDAAWIINQKTGFMADRSLGPNFTLRKQVLKAEANIRGTITPGKIISEQTFGFWTSLFEPRHYRLINGRVMSCFPLKPGIIDRVDIAKSLKDIREFRNRIYHNEAICFNNITIDFAHAQNVKTEIYNILNWMDSDLRAYVITFDEVDAKIADALKI
ncbi:MAG: hypothetical protein V4590_11710 [Bacteroidota bacterium]